MSNSNGQEHQKEGTREDRIRDYAYAWSEFRKANNCPGTAAGDWARAEHIVQAEDLAKEKEQHDN